MSLFDDFCSEGEVAVERWIRDRQPEDDFTEYKSGAIFEKARLTRQGRQQLGAEIAGMANSGGGSLFIGISTKQQDSLDLATHAVPIDEVERALSHLKGQINNLVQPPVPDVEFRLARCSSDPTKGYIAILVKRSEARPHMCTAPDSHTYFKRSGTSSMPMSPFEVEDQFNRVRRAELSSFVRLEQRGSIGGVNRYHVQLMLENTSDLSALNAYCSVETKGLNYLDEYEERLGFRRVIRLPKGGNFYAEPHIVIPPGFAVCAGIFGFAMTRVDDRIEIRNHGEYKTSIIGPIQLESGFGCRDVRQKRLVWKLTEEQAEDLYDSGRLEVRV